jgi:serine/threonine protein kinase
MAPDPDVLRRRLLEVLDTRRFSPDLVLLGSGGEGVVFKTRQKGLDCDVVIKAIAIDPRMSDEDLLRHRREVDVVKNLTHGSIRQVLDYEARPEKAIAWIVMRFIDGDSLRTRIQQCRDGGSGLTIEATMAYAEPILWALHHAHERDFVHRDVKPGNILIDRRDDPWLTDFGLGKQLGVDAASRDSFVGTYPYMSYEQLYRPKVDNRTDIYSMGLVMVECLAGRFIYDGLKGGEIASLKYDGVVPIPHGTFNDCPRHVEDAIMRMIAKYPENRPATAAEALSLFAEPSHKPHSVPVPQPPRRRPPAPGRAGRWLWPSLTVATGVLTVGLIVNAGHWLPGKSQDHATLADPRVMTPTAGERTAGEMDVPTEPAATRQEIATPEAGGYSDQPGARSAFRTVEAPAGALRTGDGNVSHAGAAKSQTGDMRLSVSVDGYVPRGAAVFIEGRDFQSPVESLVWPVTEGDTILISCSSADAEVLNDTIRVIGRVGGDTSVVFHTR